MPLNLPIVFIQLNLISCQLQNPEALSAHRVQFISSMDSEQHLTSLIHPCICQFSKYSLNVSNRPSTRRRKQSLASGSSQSSFWCLVHPTSCFFSANPSLFLWLNVIGMNLLAVVSIYLAHQPSYQLMIYTVKEKESLRLDVQPPGRKVVSVMLRDTATTVPRVCSPALYTEETYIRRLTKTKKSKTKNRTRGVTTF